ncbi:MAG: hypothetical protein ACE5JR_12625 [Gemmatimonadota bacterium]
MVDEKLEKRVRERLRRLLEDLPFVRLKGWRRGDGALEGRKVDLAAEVIARGEPWRPLIEVEANGEPRYIRSAVQQLCSSLSEARRACGIVAAPYISPEAGRICRNEGVGYLDPAGNCALTFANLFIERQGIARPTQERRPLRSLFAPKAGRALRVLLEEPGRSWTLQALAERAKVSLGLAFKVKERLLDLEFVLEGDEGLTLVKPEPLLRRWGTEYSYGCGWRVGARSPGHQCSRASSGNPGHRLSPRFHAHSRRTGRS